MRTQHRSMHEHPMDEARLARLLEHALAISQRRSLLGVADAVVCAMESLASATGNHQRLDAQYLQMLADATNRATNRRASAVRGLHRPTASV
jgi:hypothetical protein